MTQDQRQLRSEGIARYVSRVAQMIQAVPKGIINAAASFMAVIVVGMKPCCGGTVGGRNDGNNH